ncbi:prolipoprotein diacylglyceryl transferase, partial [Mycolicibacterium vaccae]
MTTTVLAYIPSPSQGVWHLGPFPVRAYALFIIAGIIAALVIGDRRWVARGGQPGVIYDVALWAVPFGLIGGRLYHVLTDWRTYFGEGGVGAAGALRIWDGGLGIWGAVALGGVGAWIACRRYGIPLPAFGDAVAPGIVLAQAIGRLGNYFNQELYGRETTVPWGLEIYERVNTSGVPDALNGVSTGQLVQVVHPTFLYELLWNLLVFVVLIVVDRRFNIGHGRLFALYVAGYCAGRFWIELLRSDAATELAGIRVNSFTSTFVFIGAVVYIMAAPKGREDPATLRGKVDVEAGAEDLAKVAAVASGGGIVAAAKAAEEDAARESKGDEAEVEALISELESGESSPSAGGLGSVDGDEAAAAVADAGVAHEVAVEGEAEAEELVADVESEPEQEVVDAESVIAVDESGEAEVVEAEAGGLGSVDGDEVAASVADAGVAHEVAVEGEALRLLNQRLQLRLRLVLQQLRLSHYAVDESGEAEVVEGDAEELVADVESEPEQEVVDAESVIAVDESGEAEVVEAEAGGLGSVDGDEVAASVADAGVAHEVAVEGEADAEELVADVESESEQEVVDAESVIAVDESGEAEVVE